MQLIPAIDLKDGRCVRLYQGAFDEVTEYDQDPVALAARWLAMGVAWLHVVDLDGARDGYAGNRALVARIAEGHEGRIQTGGGVRSGEDVAALLAAGAGRVVVGSVAVDAPETLRDWLAEFGAERLVLALDVMNDAAGVPRLRTRGWTEGSALSLWEALEYWSTAGARHVLCTDVSRDGALNGPNVALYAEARRRQPDLEMQASGGVRSLADLEALRAGGVAAAIVGKALLEGRISDQEIRSFLRAA